MKLSQLIHMLNQELDTRGDIDVYTRTTKIKNGSVAGGGFYGLPYEIDTFEPHQDIAMCFDKVVFLDE